MAERDVVQRWWPQAVALFLIVVAGAEARLTIAGLVEKAKRYDQAVDAVAELRYEATSHAGRIAALEELVSVRAIREHAVWRTNVERDLDDLRRRNKGMACEAVEPGRLLCAPVR